MKAFKLLALTSCVLLAAGNGVAQQNYSKVKDYCSTSIRISDPVIMDTSLLGRVFRMEWYSWVLLISIKVGTGARVIIIPIVF